MAKYDAALAAWEAKTQRSASRSPRSSGPAHEAIAKAVAGQFPPAVQAMVAKPPAERSPYEQQIAYLVDRQVEDKI